MFGQANAMEGRMLPQPQFTLYRPVMGFGGSATLNSATGSPPQQVIPIAPSYGVSSQSHLMHALGQQHVQRQQPWQISSPAASGLTNLPPSSSYLSTAYQTALLLSRLHQESVERQQQALCVPRSSTNMDKTLMSPSKVMMTSDERTMNTGKDASSPASKKRSISSDSDSEKSNAKHHKNSGGSTDSEDSESDREMHKATSLRGERRLVIAFENLGTRGQYPQTFGKSGALVPDGVSGTHTVYNERWRFHISHAKEFFTIERMKCVCLTWTIVNLNSGATTSITETRDEAVIRNSQGQTISNKVFREALENRAKDLERRLREETNPKKVSQIETLVKGLRPKRFSEGPLIFGLQHKVVQDKMLENII